MQFACVWCEDDVGYPCYLPMELFPNTSCLLTIGTHLCVVEIIDHLHVGVCFLFALSLAKFVSTPIAFRAT